MVLDLLFKDGCVVHTSPMPVFLHKESNLCFAVTIACNNKDTLYV